MVDIVERLDAAADPSWGEYPAEEYTDAMVAAMKLGGVDYMYFVSGTEIVYWQEAIAKAEARGWAAPRLITSIHESVALNAAMGSAMVTGKPAATAVHVDVGTFAYGGGIHTAWRGPYPILMTAGTGPRAYPESMPGARNNAVQWVQEPRDQGEILRQYTKMDHRLEHQDNPGLIISRLLQVAMSEPRGPVYISVPRESAMLALNGKTRFPTRDELGVARPVAPDSSDARQIAQWLIQAESPCIYPGKSGRNPESVDDLVRLAELLAIPVLETGRVDRMNFPTNHPLFGTGPQPRDADVLLVLENPVPWQPPRVPAPDAKVVWVDPDPVQSRYKTMEFRADMWLPVSVASFARAVYEAARGMLSKSDMDRIADRRARLERRKQELVEADERRAEAAGKRRPLSARWVSYQACRLMEDPSSIIVDDTISSTSSITPNYHRRSQPGTYFSSGGSSGGFGSGAAFGAKVAKPDVDVLMVSGDGFMLFGSPLAALWNAAHAKAPFLSVVFVNRSYSTGVNGLKLIYPEGMAVETNNYQGGVFDPPPDFAKMAEAANCYGETVSEPDEVGPALRRGLDQVHKGTPALIAAYLPTLVEEMALPQP